MGESFHAEELLNVSVLGAKWPNFDSLNQFNDGLQALYDKLNP